MGQAIGFVGLGLLGQAMALRLAQEGFSLVVWNREQERTAPLLTTGAVVAHSLQEVAERCAVICLCVIDGAAVREVVFGAQGIARAAPAPRMIIDFSTVTPAETRALAGEAEQHGLSWIDAPVSGGPAAAAVGALTLMAGGMAAELEASKAIFQALACRFTHVGGVGSGQAMKVLNQALVGGTFVMLAEVLALARSLGLPAEIVPHCLEGGLADSVALQRVWPRMAGEQYEPPTGRAGQMFKDLKSVDALRAVCGLELPLIEAAIGQYKKYVEERGAAEQETVSIARLYGA
ncbi:MAG: NAD(P)-dependent oxidoreductase [Pseudomonadota bacterium]